MRSLLLFLPVLALLGQASGSSDYFVPTHRVSGIGVTRDDISDELLEARTDLMIQTQTFTIMRESLATIGARRITSDAKLQSLFRSASARSGFPQPMLEAITYLESWGDPNAESATGPRGIMQISEATARGMGLKIARATRYRVVRERVPVRSKSGKPKFRTAKRRIPYTVTVRDDRMVPSRAIPAAAMYLASLEQKFGGRDWAVFAYHCGPGCVGQLLELTRRARGIPKDEITVARMFFSCNPIWNRELYEALQAQMQRDWSPTYWFRIMRAQQLLALYRRDPREFESLAQEYRSEFNSARAPHRLAVWLKRTDLMFHSCEDIRSDVGKKLLAKAFDRPDYFGYSLNILADAPANIEYFSEASPAAIGALTYISFETRRLFEALKPPGEKFRPLEISALVEPEDFAKQLTRREALAHCSGQVFDIDYSGMPPGELECLRFVLDDLGWSGYLGFVDEGSKTMHIGASPTAREFFDGIFSEASGVQVTD